MPYCTNCGKELKPGEICDCQKARLEAEGVYTAGAGTKPETAEKVIRRYGEGKFFARLWKAIKSIMLHPTEAIPEFVHAGDVGLSLMLLGILFVILMAYGMVELAVNGSTAILLSDVNTVGRYFLKIPIALLTVIIEAAVIFLVLLIVTAKSDLKPDFGQALALASLTLLPIVFGTLIGNFLMLVPERLLHLIGSAVVKFFNVLSAIYLFMAYRLYIVKEDKLPQTTALVVALMLFFETTLIYLL